MSLRLVGGAAPRRCARVLSSIWPMTASMICRSISANVDDREIRNFQRLANEWWKPDGELRLLMLMNRLRVPFVRDGLLQGSGKADKSVSGQALKGFKVLDVGCGGGILCEPLARLGANVTGIDPVPEAIQVALTHAMQDPDFGENLTYSCSTVESLFPKYESSFDGVIASEVIEHVVDPFDFVKASVKLIKPGGSLFLTTMNKTRLAWATAIIAAENILGLVPRGTHDWEKFVPPEDLTFMAEKCGCRVNKIHGMFYSPLLDQWDWQDSTVVHYALHAIKKK